jgi:hypothetical protein
MEEIAFKTGQKAKKQNWKKINLLLVWFNRLRPYLTHIWVLCVFSRVNILGFFSFMQTSIYNWYDYSDFENKKQSIKAINC